MSEQLKSAAGEGSMSIRIRPLIRYLGATVGIVAGFASTLEFFYFLVYPQETVARPGRFVLSLILASLANYFAYRWLTIGGTASNREIYLRGLVRKFRFPTNRLGRIMVVSSQENVEAAQLAEDLSQVLSRVGWSSAIPAIPPNSGILLQTGDGKTLGKVPQLLTLSPEYPKFLAYLQKLAEDSRNLQTTASAAATPEKPVQ